MTIRLYELVGSDATRPFSPHCWKSVWSLAHKGLETERVPVRFTEVPAVEGGFAKTVPVIRDGERLVADSFAIALYLEDAYPDRPSLFGGDGGEAMARFIERWSQLTIHPYLTVVAARDIHERLDPADQTYFRSSREARLGKTLEDVEAGRDCRREAFRASLEPLRSMLDYQPFLGGESPLYPDYIVASAFQWARIMSPYQVLDENDPIQNWFERCLDLFEGLGFSAPAAGD